MQYRRCVHLHWPGCWEENQSDRNWINQLEKPRTVWMTSIKESIRRMLERSERLDAVRSDFAYRVHWTGEVRKWDQRKRGEVRNAVEEIAGLDAFDANEDMRRYRIEEVDSELHSGESLMALLQVLEAFKNPRG